VASRKPKTGRLADDNARRIARDWVDLYREAQAQPDGRLCLNPDDAPCEQTWLDGNDPAHLLGMLEDFATLGTFEQVGEAYQSIRRLLLRRRFNTLRGEGYPYLDAILQLAEEQHVAERTIERWLSTTNGDTD
jgi:hypothetical protein